MHERFNKVLEIESKKHNFVYIDCFSPLIDAKTGAIDRRFISHDMNDCHLSNFQTPLVKDAKAVIENALKRVFLAIEKDFDFF